MSRSRRFTASLELPPPRSSSTSPVRPSKLLDQTTKGSKTKAAPCNPAGYDPRGSPMEHNAPGLSSEESSPTDTSKLKGKESVSTESLELKAELARLQEKEAILSHLLSLEKEQRIRAEQLVEVERLACLKWRHRLGQNERCGAGGDKEEVDFASEATDEAIEETASEKSESCSGEDQDSKGSHNEMLSVMEGEEEFDFSSSIFGLLTSDLQKILSAGANIAHTTQSSLSRALTAIKSNHPQDLRQCLSSLLQEDGLPLLKLAAERGHVGCVRVLLAEDKFRSCRAKQEGTTPLHLAAKNAHKRSLQALLEYCVPLDPMDYEGHTPLFLALRGGHGKCAEMIIRAGASLDVISNSGQTLLHAAVIGQLPDLLRTLIIHFRTAVEGSRFEEMLNKKDDDLRTALHYSSSKGFKNCTEILCTCSELAVSQKDRWNRTPLDMAINDTKDILFNRESKSVTLYVRISPHLLPHSTWARSCEPPAEGEGLSLAVGTLNILRYHRLSDVELMVSNALQQYCFCLDNVVQSSNASTTPKASGRGFDDGGLGLTERIAERYQLAKKFIGPIPKLELEIGTEDGSVDQTSGTENGNETPGVANGNETPRVENGNVDKESYTEHCKRYLKDVYKEVVAMDTSGCGVGRYVVGEFDWEAGKLPKRVSSKNLFGLFEETSNAEEPQEKAVYITLKGASDGHLDELSLKLMIPTSQLRDYVEVLKDQKKLMIHGPQGSGKSHLARSLADFMKNSCGPSHTQVIHTCFHRSFERGDIFRLLYLNGLLLPVTEKGAVGLSGTEYKTHVLVLDDLSLLPHPNLLAELLSVLEYRGVEHSIWINTVMGSDGSTVLYPGGLYYLKEECHVIATWTTGCGSTLPVIATDQFPHVSLDTTSGPIRGVLRRHLMAATIHHAKGVWPHMTQPLYRLIRWVGDIWLMYVKFVEDLELSSMATGLRHFLSCPVNSEFPERDIPQWLNSIWQHHLVPSLEFGLQESLDLRGSQQQENAQQIGTQLLQAIVGLVLLPTCPLSFDECGNLLRELLQNLDSFFFTPSITTNNNSGGGGGGGSSRGSIPPVPARRSPTKPVPIINIQNSYSPHSLSVRNPAGSPLLKQRRGSLQSLHSPPTGRRGLLNRGTPPLTERRGSLCDLRVPPFLRNDKKAENIVSFEDMIRDLPNSRRRTSSLEKKVDMTATPTAAPPVSRKTSEEEEKGLEGVEGEEDKSSSGKKGKANKALKKIRSKTISLFSKDGTGTLPRLFRRGSRASLVAVSEEDSKLPFSNSTPGPGGIPQETSKPEFTRSLGDMKMTNLYDMVNSSHSKEQRSPTTSSPVRTMSDEDQDVVNALDDLDDFLDLLSTSTTDRIENQRSPLPTLEQKSGARPTVPKYYISTSSQQRQNYLSPMGLGLREMSPPAYSMPDLTVESVEEVEEDSGSENSPDGTVPHVTTQHYQEGGHHRKSQSYDQTTLFATQQQYRDSFHEKSQSYDQSRDQSHDLWGDADIGRAKEGSDNYHKSHSSIDLTEASQSTDGYWQVTSPPGSGEGSSYLSPPKSVPSPRRRASDSTVRPTSPLAMHMMSYATTGPQDCPDKSKTGGAQFFTYQKGRHLSKKRNSTSSCSGDRLGRNKKTLQQQQDHTPTEVEMVGVHHRRADMVEDAKLNKPEEMIDRAGKNGARITNNGQQWVPTNTSTPHNDACEHSYHHHHRNQRGHHSAESSPQHHLTRGRYVNQESGKVYKARSNSYKRDLTSSYQEPSRNAKMIVNFSSSVKVNERREGGWRSSSETNLPTTTAAMFSASLGSRDRFGSIEDEAEEML